MDSPSATFKYTHVVDPRLDSIPTLERLENEPGTGIRYYTDGKDKYISVTSFLAAKPKPQLEAWKARVGDAAARRVSLKATTKGSALHAMAEATLRNEPVVLSETVSKYEWNAFKSVLKRIDNIYLIERPIFSPSLKLAGTPDAIAQFDGVNSVIDFKTSSRMKEESFIEDYYLQATAYSVMFTELTAIPVDQIVIAISINNSYPQVFVRDVKDYLPKLRVRLKEYVRDSFMR